MTLSTRLPILLLGCSCLLTCAARAAIVQEPVDIEGNYTKFALDPADGGVLNSFSFKAAPGNFAGPGGLLREGFGIGSVYVPGRRLNVQLEVLEQYRDRPVLQYSYGCDGPNIAGLHVTRLMEPLPDESSMRVTWTIENRGEERQWLTPWVRFDVSPGGSVNDADRLDLPTVAGILDPKVSGFHGAARNWAAATDPIEQHSFVTTFSADDTMAFFALRGEPEAELGIQTVLVPRILAPGETWKTVYRVSAFRGLNKVDFASGELAVELRREPGRLTAVLAASKVIGEAELHARVVAPNGRAWRLPAKKVTLAPDRGAHCEYEWVPPADGAYEFLAQLTRDGKPIPLGDETASPHGGIDTQFIIGDVIPGFEPWTNAPYALERSGRPLTRALAASGDVDVWFASGIEKVFREDRAESGGPLNNVARVVLARNEYEAFQVVVRPAAGQHFDQARLEIGPVRNANGDVIPKEDIEVRSVMYHHVRIPSYFEGPTGWWPDALPPFESINLEAERNTPIYVRVHARPTLAPGNYRGPLRLVFEGRDPIELILDVRVFGFALPDTPALKTDFGYWAEAAARGAAQFGAKPAADALNAAYLGNALEHRVTLRDLAQFPLESADYAADLRRFTARMDTLLEEGATTLAVPPSLLDTPEPLRQANAFVAEHHLEKRVFVPLAEEPLEPAWPRTLETIQQWKDLAPDIPVMISAAGLRPLLHPGIDIWAVHSPVFDTPHGRELLDRIGSGGEVWWYVDAAPPRPYANLLLDFTGVEHRILFWQAWALGVKGMHYWAVNYADDGQNPWRDSLDTTPVNGDGLLVYPAPDGPVDSMRWECVRDGIEDYDYLVLFTALRQRLVASGKNPALLDMANAAGDLSALLPDLVTFPRDAAVLLQKREALGDAIEKMQAVLK